MYLDRVLENRLKLRLLFATPVRNVFDDGETGEEPPVEEPPVEPPIKKPVTKKTSVEFSKDQQDYVNSLVAEERRKGKAATDRAITQLETERNKASTTQAEKELLDQRIEEIKNAQLTQEQLRLKDEKKKETKWQSDLNAVNQERDHWKNLFTSTTIQRELVEAASKPGHKAHNPRHVVNELAPKTRLVEELDLDGKPTGSLIPKVKLTTTGKDNKPVTLEMTPTEAVKWMSEQEEHSSLFDSGATGGLGGSQNSRRGRNSDEPPTDPAEYQVWRKQQKAGARK